MSPQLFCQGIIVIGGVAAALAAFGTSFFDSRDSDRRDAETKTFQSQASDAQKALKDQVSSLQGQIKLLQAAFDKNTEVIVQAFGEKDQWTDVALNNIPSGAADYALLLFRSDNGRISGKVRIKGNTAVSNFSTTANNNLPVAVPNHWVPAQHQYQIPTVLQFAITEKTDPTANLSILTAGWIDKLGQEPH